MLIFQVLVEVSSGTGFNRMLTFQVLVEVSSGPMVSKLLTTKITVNSTLTFYSTLTLKIFPTANSHKSLLQIHQLPSCLMEEHVATNCACVAINQQSLLIVKE